MQGSVECIFLRGRVWKGGLSYCSPKCLYIQNFKLSSHSDIPVQHFDRVTFYSEDIDERYEKVLCESWDWMFGVLPVCYYNWESDPEWWRYSCIL